MPKVLTRDSILIDILDEVIPEVKWSIGDNLLSVFLVGSMANEHYVLGRNNDFDLRFVIAEVTELAMDKIATTMERLAHRLSSESLIVTTSDMIGPVRHNSGDISSLLLHYIVLTERALLGLSKLHRQSYSQNYLWLYGKDFVSPFKMLRYSADDICYSVEGIFYCIDMLQRRKLKFQRWAKCDGGITLQGFEEDMDDITYAETLRYALIKSSNNCRTWLQWNEWDIDDDICRVLEALRLDLDDELRDYIASLVYRRYESCDLTAEATGSIMDLLKAMASAVLRLDREQV